MQKQFLFLILGAVCWITVAASSATGELPSGEILVFFSGNTLGELKPCGCAKEEDQGGIERRMGFLRESLKAAQNTLLVDTGDSFKEPTRQGKIKARFLAESMLEMGYDAVALGDHDLVYGTDFIIEENKALPWVVGNMVLDNPSFPQYRIKRFADGLKAAVVALVDPDLFYGLDHAGIAVLPPQQAIVPLLEKIHAAEAPDLVVLLTHMTRDKALKFLDQEGIDIVINGHMADENTAIDMTPVRRNGRIFVQPGPRGQKLGEIRVSIGPEGRKSFHYRMIRLDSSVKEDPEMVKLYKKYNEEIEALFFASVAARRQNRQKKVFATETRCKTCHPAAHAVWARSRHGRAYSTLRKVNKAFDPECLGCHVTGFGQPGGFISEVDTPELKNVQCEVCHGSGLKHAEAPGPGFGKEAGKACMKCHVKNHSPRFDYDKYWPEIKH